MKIKLFFIAIGFIVGCKKSPPQNCIDVYDKEIYVESSTNLIYNIDCELCQTDDRLKTENIIYITIEALPNLDGSRIDTVEIGDKINFKGELDVKNIPNKDSLIIGIIFYENPGSRLEHAVYEKVKINHLGNTVFNKQVMAADIWNKPPCSLITSLNLIPDLSTGVIGTSCLIGSPGDCFEFGDGLLKTEDELCDILISNEIEWLEYFNNQKASTPCHGVYTKLQE